MKRAFGTTKMYAVVLVLVFTSSVFAQQLDTVFKRMFDNILVDQFNLSPGLHGNHFKPAAAEADSLLTPALNSLVASNISSFPLSSTNAGVTFDFSRGTLEAITESGGPVFAETAKTLGRGKLNIGFNYNYLSLARFRGLRTEDIRFTFAHQDVPPILGNLGDNPNEYDTVELILNTDINASIFALYTTFGVTNSLDIGIAVPFINVSIQGVSQATVDSYTFVRLGVGNHFFSGDTTNPGLTANFPVDETASGIGDVAVRLKANFVKNQQVDFAGLLDVRLPTGDEKNFLGTGSTNIRALAILSKKLADFTPHLNIGYEYRGADLDSDQFEFIAGFDHKLTSNLTFALDLLGRIEVNGDKMEIFPDSQNPEIVEVSPLGGTVIRTVDRTNIPEANNDNNFSSAIGVKYTSSESLILAGNILVALNDGGLRSSVVPTLGIAFNF